ncbi:MAG TPA: hypothetical protein VGN25_03470 [Solirubrobacteraceae bacterium]|jgi:hypothetical protein|nr:hypothetical protein [Solirubrobacteraceae bacterium]
MLYILIPAAWVAIGTFFAVIVCRAAARGDRAMAQSIEPGTPSRSFAGVVLFEGGNTGRIPHDERIGGERFAKATAGSVRSRRSHCVTR